jgi:hypothetical protein
MYTNNVKKRHIKRHMKFKVVSLQSEHLITCKILLYDVYTSYTG